MSNDPNAERGIRFQLAIDDNYQETWAQGLSVFHNPRARHPLDPAHFPDLLHHFFRDGQIETSHHEPDHSDPVHDQ